MFPKIFRFLTLLISTCRGNMESETEYFAYCSPRFYFCLYTEGIPLRNASVNEATKACQKISKNGTLIYMDQYTKNGITEFAINYSLPNILLNAKLHKGKWIWIPTKEAIVKTDNMVINGSYFFFKMKPKDDRFFVVCMSVCKGEWKVKGNTQTDNMQVTPVETVENLTECKEVCQFTEGCRGIDWEPRVLQKCGLILGTEKLRQIQNYYVIHYELDRSVRKLSKCLAGIKMKRHRRMLSRIFNSNETSLTRIKNPWATYILASMISAVVVMLYYGLTKKSPAESSEE